MSVSASDSSPFTIHYRPYDNQPYYEVGEGDTDGRLRDGRQLTEAELNTLLVTQGAPVRAENGEFFDNEGNRVGGRSVQLAQDGAPELPDQVGGPTETGERTADKTNYVGYVWELLNPSELHLVTSILLQGDIQERKNAKQAKHALQAQKLRLKDEEIRNTAAKIEEEKNAATFKFMTAMAAVAVTGIMGVAAAQGGGQAMMGMMMGVSQMVNAGGEMFNKNWGPQSRADKYDLQAKYAAREQEQVQQAIESVSDWAQAVQDLFRDTKRLVDEHNERQLQISNAINRA